MPNAKGWRTRKDPRTGDMVQLGDIVDGLMREEVFSRGIPIAELASKWPQIVGERLAAETAPTALEGTVLTVSATNGPWGAQARFLHEQIRLKANQALGSEVIAIGPDRCAKQQVEGLKQPANQGRSSPSIGKMYASAHSSSPRAASLSGRGRCVGRIGGPWQP